MDSITVLVVEDSPIYRRLIRGMLDAAQTVPFDPHEVGDLKSATKRITQDGFDAVLLDLGLPDSDGLATYRKFRKVCPAIPVVVLTGNDDESSASTAIQEGAADYLVKGEVTANWLTRSLRYAVDRSRSKQRDASCVETPSAPVEEIAVVEGTVEGTVVRFTESHIVGQESIAALQEQLTGLVEQGCRMLDVNFGGVEYVSNPALGTLVAVHKKLDAAGGTLRLREISDDVYEMLKARHLHRVLHIASS